ncbi:uncharacterized protein isoform X2 [Macaca fascicularis]|uniref:uncharacterized protein isoform X2 n=1 Tax=Macaca fascicularis TaxID=9541 RepID=UPI0032B05293
MNACQLEMFKFKPKEEFFSLAWWLTPVIGALQKAEPCEDVPASLSPSTMIVSFLRPPQPCLLYSLQNRKTYSEEHGDKL